MASDREAILQLLALADAHVAGVMGRQPTDDEVAQGLDSRSAFILGLKEALAAPPSAQDETIELVRELQSTYEGMVYHESDRAYTLALSKLLKVPLPPPPAGAPK